MTFVRKTLTVFIAVTALGGAAITPAMAAGSGSSYNSSDTGGSVDVRRARALVAEGDYAAAIPKLEKVALAEPDNADVFNLLGFSYRKSGDTGRAAPNYETALRINPRHRGALEYQGELFLMLNQPEKAEANLAKIDDIFWLKCDEARDLENAIAVWRTQNGS
jgi:Flp pilus assembly protein TadD